MTSAIPQHTLPAHQQAASALFGTAARPASPAISMAADSLTFAGNKKKKKKDKQGYEATTKQKAVLAEIYKGHAAPNIAYYMDAVKHPELLQPSKAINIFIDVLKAAATEFGDPAHGTAYLLVDYADRETVRKVKDNIDKMNRIIKPRGLRDRALNAGFRTMLGGSQTPVQPVEIRVNPKKPTQCGFKIPVAGAPQADIEKFIRILEQAPPALLDALNMFGV